MLGWIIFFLDPLEEQGIFLTRSRLLAIFRTVALESPGSLVLERDLAYWLGLRFGEELSHLKVCKF